MLYNLHYHSSVVELLLSLPKARLRKLSAGFSIIQRYPHNSSRCTVQDREGRTLQVTLFEQYRVYYWIDDADKHVVILRVDVNE